MKDEERTPEKFMTVINSSVLAEIPNAPSSISFRTAHRWMNYLGFKATKQVKSYYTDGHNRYTFCFNHDSLSSPNFNMNKFRNFF